VKAGAALRDRQTNSPCAHNSPWSVHVALVFRPHTPLLHWLCRIHRIPGENLHMLATLAARDPGMLHALGTTAGFLTRELERLKVRRLFSCVFEGLLI
jgi:hypothetical protein